MDKKLLPCPFCGGEDIEVLEHKYLAGTWYIVICNTCYAETGEQQSKEKAIAIWNTRAIDDAVKNLVRLINADDVWIEGNGWRSEGKMIKGRLSIIGDMVVDGEELTGVFVKCARDELMKGCGDLFCEEVKIVASKPKDSVSHTR